MSALPSPLPELTLDAAAARLGIAADTLRSWIRSGRFPAFRMPSGHYRIREADLPRAYEPAGTAPERHVEARR